MCPTERSGDASQNTCCAHHGLRHGALPECVQVGFPPEDIIFDPELTSIASEEATHPASVFIEATRILKAELPLCKVCLAALRPLLHPHKATWRCCLRPKRLLQSSPFYKVLDFFFFNQGFVVNDGPFSIKRTGECSLVTTLRSAP